MEAGTSYKLGIVGGCFPAQHNVPPQDLFHQKLLSMVEEETGYAIDLHIERYEQLKKAVSKVRRALDCGCNGIIFQVRPDPYLRLSKLWYKYADEQKRIRYALTIPQFYHFPSEQQIYETSAKQVVELIIEPKSKIRSVLRELNYCAGIVTRSNAFALKQYVSLVVEIDKLCVESGATLIVLGAGSRPRTMMEQYLSWKLERYVRNAVEPITSIHYVNMWGTHSETGESLYFEDGMHVRPIGHERVAKLLYPAVATQVQNLLSAQEEKNLDDL